MLHKAPNKGKGRERTTPHLLGVAITIAKRHALVLHADDAVVASSHAEDVRGQIFERGCATPHRPAIHDPCLLPRFLCYLLVKIRCRTAARNFARKSSANGLTATKKAGLRGWRSVPEGVSAIAGAR
jgi:hypothetical protein